MNCSWMKSPLKNCPAINCLGACFTISKKDCWVTFVCLGLWAGVLRFWRKILPSQLHLLSRPDLQPDIRSLPVAPWSWCSASGRRQTRPRKSSRRPIQIKSFFVLYIKCPKTGCLKSGNVQKPDVIRNPNDLTTEPKQKAPKSKHSVFGCRL